tara:strand:- start:2569 stop:3090 length:522 start_codon:yes stop_codon:yes gene_type:complete
MLKNVRLSFPSIFKKSVFDGKEGKFEATLLIHKDDQEKMVELVESKMQKFLVEKFGSAAKIPKSLKRTCFKDGDECDYDGYENHMAFKAGSNSRPTVINRDKSPVIEDDNVIYAGCYVNAIVDFWYSDHPKGGKQCLANLLGVQFVKDGESFGAGGQDVTDEFDEVEVEDDEF